MMSSIAMIVACIMLSMMMTGTQAFQRPSTFTTRKMQTSQLNMVSGNKANFGIFSPAVVAAKFILGEAKLNKVEKKKNYAI